MGRNVKYVLHACKYWAQKQASNGSQQRFYGITFKVRRVEVKPYVKTTEDVSEDDDEVVTKFVEKEQTKVEESDDSDESDEEVEEEKVVAEKKKPVRRTKKAA